MHFDSSSDEEAGQTTWHADSTCLKSVTTVDTCSQENRAADESDTAESKCVWRCSSSSQWTRVTRVAGGSAEITNRATSNIGTDEIKGNAFVPDCQAGRP